MLPLPIPSEVRAKRIATIQRYLDNFLVPDAVPEHLAEYQELQGIKEQIIALMAQADVIAQRLREREQRSNTALQGTLRDKAAQLP